MTRQGGRGGLTRSDALFSRAGEIYRERWRLALVILLLGAAAVLAAFIAAGALCVWSLIFAPRLSGVVALMALISAAAFSSAAVVWSQAAMLTAASEPGPAPALAACFDSSWRRLPGFFLTCGLTLAACLGGSCLLVVPGLAAGVWLSFAPLIYLTEDVGPMEALLKSCHYVRGRFLPLSGRLLLLGVAGSLPGLIPVAGVALQMLAWPFVWMNMTVLLEDLRRLRRGEAFVPARGTKALLLCAMAGCLVPVVLLPWILPILSSWIRGQAQILLGPLAASLPGH